MLVRAGLHVRWVDGPQVRGDMPDAGAASAQQRSRWEGGRLRLMADQAPALALSVLGGQWRLADPLLDLLLLPLSWHVALLLGGGLVQALALGALAAVGLHVLLALCLIRARHEHVRALLGVPLYLVWKLRLAGATLHAAGRNAVWVRSVRTAV